MRESLGLTQSQLAQLLGVHPLTVSKWECEVLVPRPYEAALLERFRDAHLRQPEIRSSVASLLVGAGAAFALYKLLEAAFSDPPRRRTGSSRRGHG